MHRLPSQEALRLIHAHQAALRRGAEIRRLTASVGDGRMAPPADVLARLLGRPALGHPVRTPLVRRTEG